ncbi:MAG TPA: hypothetical protein DEG23_01815 [Coxiellaceae bacterium]|nr:hypothetical protein [Coxiellaceae bacterium]
MTMLIKNLSLVIPCFNEVNIISSTLDAIFSYMDQKHPQVQLEIILVNDGSTDETLNKVVNYQKGEKRLKLINFTINKGRGAAMKAGIAESSSEYIMFLDADLSYDVEHISEVISYFERTPKTDVIIVSPYMKGGMFKNIPILRLITSRVANWILSGFFSQDISTVTSMVRAYRAEVIKDLVLIENGKELHLEILRKLYLVGADIAEIPGRLIWKEKKNRSNRISARAIASSAKKHLLYGFLSRPTRIIGKLAIVVLLISFWEFFNLVRIFLSFYAPKDHWFGRDLWVGLSQTFNNSPHTVIIAVVGLIISIQILTYLALFSILNMQHEEQLQHLIMLFKKENNKK